MISGTSTSVVTVRLADGFVSRHHPDDILVYSGGDEQRMQLGVPEVVWRFLGKPMSEENLKQLARNDNLDIIYEDRRLPERDRVLTRSAAQSQLQAALDSDMVAAASDNITAEEEQELGPNPTNSTRSVSFGRDQIREFQDEEPVSRLTPRSS